MKSYSYGFFWMTYFKGTLVIGMIAINMTMQMDKACGYSDVNSTLAVISSETLSPNISQPTIAIAQSREYYNPCQQPYYERTDLPTVNMNVTQRLLPYFCGCLISR